MVSNNHKPSNYLFIVYLAKKGRGSSSILISTMGQARIQNSKRRKMDDDNDPMQMNAPMAGNDPNQMHMND